MSPRRLAYGSDLQGKGLYAEGLRSLQRAGVYPLQMLRLLRIQRDLAVLLLPEDGGDVGDAMLWLGGTRDEST